MWHLPDFFLTYHWRWQGEPTGHAKDYAATPGQGVQYLLSASAGAIQDPKLLPGYLGNLEAFP